MKYSASLLIALLTVITIPACGDSSIGSDRVMDRILPPMGEADRIEVRHQGNLEPFLEITDPSTIAELRQFVNSYHAGWGIPFTGPPVGQLYFDFYSQEEFLGNFYVGPSFFGRDHDIFFSMPATDEDISKISSIVGFAVLE